MINGDGVFYDTTLKFLNATNLLCLLLDGQIFVDDTNAALLRQSDCQPRFGDRIHSRRDERKVKADVTCQLGYERDVLGGDFRITRK